MNTWVRLFICDLLYTKMYVWLLYYNFDCCSFSKHWSLTLRNVHLERTKLSEIFTYWNLYTQRYSRWKLTIIATGNEDRCAHAHLRIYTESLCASPANTCFVLSFEYNLLLFDFALFTLKHIKNKPPHWQNEKKFTTLIPEPMWNLNIHPTTVYIHNF